jgi:putative ABC transport system substrate-binding protein
MRRRDFISFVGSTALVWPTSSMAAGRVWRIGIIVTSAATERLVHEFERRLGDLGYADNKNIVLVKQPADPDTKAVESAISAILPSIDLLIVNGTVGGFAAKKLVTSLPVVFVAVGAPVDIGLVESLARPGGNMTGITFEAAAETYGKRLQILKEIIPALSHVAVLHARTDPNAKFAMISLERTAPELGVKLLPIGIGPSEDMIVAFDEIERSRSEALIVVGGVLTFRSGQQIADQALARHLPSCHAFRETVAAGGLVSLGPDLAAVWRQAADYVDKIIHGAKPKELPVEQPTRYELAVNLKTARALGLTLPVSLLVRADLVIE